MSADPLYKEAMDMLKKTSRTFYIPISRLSSGVQEAVSSAYLCMRAIDEIEDDAELTSDLKTHLLKSVAKRLREPHENGSWSDVFGDYSMRLPEVTVRIGDWLALCPQDILPVVRHYTARMADGMAKWVLQNFVINTEEDLDDYTYYVAGLVGELLSDIWKWYDQTETKEHLAVAFGRGLQAVNIIRNRSEDLERGVDFFPNGWGYDKMFQYARRNLMMADEYTTAISPGPIFEFCKIPLILAHGTLNVMEAGEKKLSRAEVNELVSGVTGEK